MPTALLDDGSVVLTADWDIGNGRLIKARAIRARTTDGISLQTLNGTYQLEIDNNGNVTLSTGKRLYAREIRALDLNGVNVYNDSGDGGLSVDDSGNVTMTSQLTVAGNTTINGRLIAPGVASLGEASDIAEANAGVVRVGTVEDDWGDLARFIGSGDVGRFHWGDWENMGTSGSPKSIVFAASAFKPVGGVTAWGLVRNVTTGAMGRFDVGPVLLNTTNTLYDAGGGKTAVLQVGSNGSVILYKTGSDELDIVYFIMWL